MHAAACPSRLDAGVARTLQAERLLLPEDAAVIVNEAAAMPWPPSGKKQ